MLVNVIGLVEFYLPLQDSHALPPIDTEESELPLLLPFTTPLLLLSAAGFGLLLKNNVLENV